MVEMCKQAIEGISVGLKYEGKLSGIWTFFQGLFHIQQGGLRGTTSVEDSGDAGGTLCGLDSCGSEVCF